MQRSLYPVRGITLVELLLVLAIIGVLAALLLPAVQQSRESARRFQCQNNLHQLGLGLLNYVDSHGVFPPGYIGENPDPTDGKGWAWGTLIFPFLEQRPLYDSLAPTDFTLWQAISDESRRSLLLQVVPVFVCPSDARQDLCHSFRELTGFPFSEDEQFTGPKASLLASTTSLNFWHPPPVSAINIPVAKANYVGSFGAFWNARSGLWSNSQLRGNGILGCNSDVRLTDITDGTSNTFAVGERSWDTQAAVWCGVEQWTECTSHGNSMVLGTVFFPPNGQPQLFHLSCNGQGSAGFGSRHPGGCQFVMCDGSVRFISDTIDSDIPGVTSNLGTYQRLGQRNDGMHVTAE